MAHSISRRHLLAALPALAWAAPAPLPFRFTDVTRQAGIRFTHRNGASGKKYLPETLGPGCAFLDYDSDGWQDILFVNGMPLSGAPATGSSLTLYRNNRDGTFTDVTRQAGLDVPLYGMGVAVGDYNNDGHPDIYVTTYGQNRLFQNTGRGYFIDVTAKSGLAPRTGLSTSALWFDYDRDGLLDLFVCNYVKWSPELDVPCSIDGRHKSYCTPEAYHGSTCWLFRNRGDGTFEDVTAKAGLFDTTSKSLGVAMLDVDRDGWPDLLVANDTQPNKLYRNRRDGTFQETGVQSGVAFSDDGKARAGMGVDVADYDNSGRTGLVVTNFDNEMMALFQDSGNGTFVDQAPRGDLGRLTRRSLGFGCCFLDLDLDGRLDLLAVNGHIDDTVRNAGQGAQFAQAPQLFWNQGGGQFREVGAQAGDGFATPRVGRGAAYGDFNQDGALDLLITTNAGPAFLYRNQVASGATSLRLTLTGTKSNRDAIGSLVQLYRGNECSTAMVKTGSSYLSQSELPLTFGLGRREVADRIVVHWPSGRVEEFKNVKANAHYAIVEAKGIVTRHAFPSRA